MSGRDAVRCVGFFSDPHGAVRAVEALARQGHREVTAYSPIPEPELVEALGGERSVVRWYALAAGIAGCVSGFALTVWTSYAYPLVTGGKALASVPAYVVIAFELTILFTGIACVLALSIHNRMPRRRLRDDFDPRFTGDRFGVVVVTEPGEASAVERVLRDAGAEEVRRA